MAETPDRGHQNITVDVDTLRRIRVILNDLESDSRALNNPPGTLDYLYLADGGLKVHIGTETFTAGALLTKKVATTGTDLNTRILAVADLITGLSDGIGDYLDLADHAESLNTVSADDFMDYLPQDLISNGSTVIDLNNLPH